MVCKDFFSILLPSRLIVSLFLHALKLQNEIGVVFLFHSPIERLLLHWEIAHLRFLLLAQADNFTLSWEKFLPRIEFDSFCSYSSFRTECGKVGIDFSRAVCHKSLTILTSSRAIVAEQEWCWCCVVQFFSATFLVRVSRDGWLAGGQNREFLDYCSELSSRLSSLSALKDTLGSYYGCFISPFELEATNLMLFTNYSVITTT